MPYLRVLSAFRDEVRSKAIAKAPLTDFLKLSDGLRDEVLIPLGVALDDQEGELDFIPNTLYESINLSILRRKSPRQTLRPGRPAPSPRGEPCGCAGEGAQKVRFKTS